jgi:hypothetical protein
MAALTATQASENVLDLLRESGETMGPAEIARRLASRGKLGQGNHNTQRGRAVTACALLLKQGLVAAVPLEGGGNHYRAASLKALQKSGARPRNDVQPLRAAPPPPPARLEPVIPARPAPRAPEPAVAYRPAAPPARPEPRPVDLRPTPAPIAARPPEPVRPPEPRAPEPRTAPSPTHPVSAERKLVPVFTGNQPDPHGLPPQSGLF